MIGRMLRERASEALANFVVDAFHKRYYAAKDTWQENRYLGFRVSQLPSDLWIYQELVHRLKPRYVLQTGVYLGGSALFFAHLLDALGADPSAIYVGVDVELTADAKRLSHPRIRLVEASSTDAATIERLRELLPAGGGLVSLDSDHSASHVRREIDLYRQFVAVGSYLVVEDTNVNGHPVFESHGPGPREAVDDYLAQHDDFVRDDALWRRHLISFHQGGWLRRVR
jgi:cephalosporin hydroxylase